jgi:hypothetical protein
MMVEVTFLDSKGEEHKIQTEHPAFIYKQIRKNKLKLISTIEIERQTIKEKSDTNE